MSINWGLFLPALVLLMYPLDRILPAHLKCRSFESLSDPAYRHRRRWWRWQPELWVDILRIFLGAWFVNFSVQPGENGSGLLVQLLVGLIMAVALCSQMFTRRKEDAALAPLGFLLAVLLVFLPVTAAMAVFALAVAALVALQDFLAFFLAGTVAAAGLGYLFGGGILTVVMLVALFLLPVLFSLLAGRKLLLPVRSMAAVEKPHAPAR